MKIGARSLALLVAFAFAAAGCGGGGGSMRSLPGTGSAGSSANHNVAITLTIPTSGSASGASITHRTPQTVSAATQSITVSVNGGTPQIFNVNSSTCTTGQNGMTCTLVVGAPFGADGFLVITYSGQNGTGTPLNAAAFTLNVTQGGTNSASATAGNLILVNSSADGSGSGFNCSGGTCTLREAVAEASTTLGVYTAIMFQGPTSITVSSPIEIGHSGAQNIILLGPGATVPSPGTGAPTASSGLTISGGNTSGIFTVDSGSFFSVVGLTLAGGNDTSGNQYGGAIYSSGTIALINAILKDNTAYYGGAIYDAGSGTSSAITSTFTNNTATGTNGGAIDEELGFTVSHSLFDSNAAYDGVASGEGGAIYANWDLVVDSSTFTKNIAGNAGSTGGYAYGGAIEIDDGTPTITNSIFGTSTSDGNVANAGSSGGAAGGAIVIDDTSTTLTLAGNSFTGNQAIGGYEAYGGAVTSWYDPVSSTSDNFVNNTADGTSGAVDSSDTGGGAVYILDAAAASTFQGTGSANETFSGNVAKGGPGGVYAYAGALYVGDYAFIGTNLTFSNNTVTEAASVPGAGSESDAGALFADSGPMSLENVQFTGNAATAADYSYGGGAESDYSTVVFETVSFTSNQVSGSQEAGGGAFGDYDGLVATCSLCATARHLPQSLVARRAAMQARRTARAAALTSRRQRDKSRLATRKATHVARVHAQGAQRHIAANFVHPQATRQQLPICAESCFDNVTLGSSGSGNTANAASGASYGAHGGGADLSGDFVITATTVSNNSATGGVGGAGAHGGGISYGDYGAGTLTFTGTISNNTTVNAGGGFYNYDTATIIRSAVTGNSVTAVANSGDGGGGIWDGALLYLTQSTVSGNSVSGTTGNGPAGGGGMFDSYGAPYLTNSTIASNTSAQDGGGLEVQNAYVSILNSTFVGNSTAGYGGNFYDVTANSLILQGNIFAGGSATTGGPDLAIDNTSATSSGYNLIQTSVQNVGDSLFTPGTGDLIAGSAPSLSQTTFTVNGVTMMIYSESSNSPTKDAIPLSVCTGAGVTVDQRGNARGDGGDNLCDMGSYEYP